MNLPHNRPRPLPAVAVDHTFHCFERDKVFLGVESIAILTPFGRRQHAPGFIVAHLLDAYSYCQSQIDGAQIATKYHVKLPSAMVDFTKLMISFISHRTKMLSLNLALSCLCTIFFSHQPSTIASVL